MYIFNPPQIGLRISSFFLQSSKTEHLESENLRKNSKPRKKILIKRFKSKSKTKQKKNRSTLEKILESLDLTPAEYLYLSKYYSFLNPNCAGRTMCPHFFQMAVSPCKKGPGSPKFLDFS